MLHLFGGGTETRRLPGASQFPWKEIRLAVIALIAVGALVYGVTWAVSRGSENTSAPAAVQAVEQPVAQPFDSAQGKPVQQVPVAPVAPEVVDYHGVWNEVTGFDPSTIPVEKGLYNGTIGYTNPDPETLAYAWKILPHLEKEGNRFVTVSAARDETNKDIVLIALDAEGYKPYILLSVDGERSLCKLDLLPVDSNGDDAMATRVVARGEIIHLYAKDPRPGNHWWTATVKKSELPCS